MRENYLHISPMYLRHINIYFLVQKKSLAVPHDWYAPITVLPYSMDSLICITRVEIEGFQSLVRFFHKHRSLCLLLLVN